MDSLHKLLAVLALCVAAVLSVAALGDAYVKGPGCGCQCCNKSPTPAAPKTPGKGKLGDLAP
jgi:hypothetical protein